MVDGMFRTAALAGLVLLAAGSAQAQGWYNVDLPPGPLDARADTKPVFNTYNGLFTGPGGQVLSGTVNTWSMNLGSGVSMSMFSSVSNGPAFGMAELPGNGFNSGFPGMSANYANGLNFNPAIATPMSTGGRMAFDLGHGLSMDFIGGMSRGAGMAFGPFDNHFSSSVGTGFTMNFGHGGSLSLIGSVSRSYGCSGFMMAGCR